MPLLARPGARAVRAVCAVLLAATAALPLRAQPPARSTAVTWPELAAAPGARATEVAWLRRHLDDAERSELAALVGALSAPAAAQGMASYLHADGSVLVPFTEARALADSLAERPADGDAGLLHVAYLAARRRASPLAGWGKLGVFAPRYRDAGAPPVAHAARAAAAGRARVAPGVAVRLRFDFAPAESLLAIVGTPDVSPAEVMRRLDAPAFDALLAHHSASFYRLPWTRELMAVNLARAASTLAVDRLYAWENPKGCLDYADVSRHRARYRALLDDMRAREPALLAEVEAEIAPFLPAGTRLERTASLYFADGADGWTSRGVAAVDLEWFKDDWPRLRGMLVHETFHAAQHAARRPAARAASDGEAVLRGALETVFREGTANHVAPSRPMSAEERAAAARAGAALLDSLVAAVRAGDLPRARALHDRGESGAGPFYSLGAAMTAAIVDALGAPAVAATLPEGGVAFARRYLEAGARRPGGAAMLAPNVADAVRALRE